jgi:HD-GYP domain-containing protein (c-di-GMP phosphodiesterase class II)
MGDHEAHPEMGLDILRRLGKFEKEAEVVIAHHERIDGSGYPHRLRGDDIPIGARILAVAETYDVLVSDRPYRRARTRAEAIKILDEESGPHLWTPAVDALKQMLVDQAPGDRRATPRVPRQQPGPPAAEGAAQVTEPIPFPSPS